MRLVGRDGELVRVDEVQDFLQDFGGGDLGEGDGLGGRVEVFDQLEEGGRGALDDGTVSGDDLRADAEFDVGESRILKEGDIRGRNVPLGREGWRGRLVDRDLDLDN